MSLLRAFLQSDAVKARGSAVLAADTASSPAKQGGSPADEPPSGAKAPEATDDSGLRATGTVFVSPDSGTTDEPHPEHDVAYDFCAHVVNAGKRPSGPFLVRFKLTEDQDWQEDFEQEDGLAPGESVLAVVHFGELLKKHYRLSACIHPKSAPDKPIHCAGEFGIVVT